MRLVIETSETTPPKIETGGLDAALAKQFGEIQQSLLRLGKAKPADHTDLLASLKKQQDGLLAAMERLMDRAAATPPTDALVASIQDLKDSMAKHSSMGMDMGLMMDKMDSLIQAVLTSKSSRSRTFGSNF